MKIKPSCLTAFGFFILLFFWAPVPGFSKKPLEGESIFENEADFSEISNGNIPPQAKLCSKYVVHMPAGSSSTEVDGSCSYDPDGTIVSYHWELSGTTPKGGKIKIEQPNSAKTKLSRLENGFKYAILLTVTDNEGATAVTYFTLYVDGEIESKPLKADIDFSDASFQLSNWWAETGEPWSFKVSHKFGDNPVGRYELRYTDKIKGGSKRSQSLFNSFPEDAYEVWTGFNVYFPKDWTPDFKPEAFYVNWIHNKSGKGDDLDFAPFLLQFSKGELEAVLRYSYKENAKNKDAIIEFKQLGSPIRGEWISYVIHTKADLNNGVAEVWRNGEKILDYSGPLAYNHNKIRGFIPVFGIYKWPWQEYGRTNVDKRVVYYDDIKIADGEGNYNLVAPPQKKNKTPVAKVKENNIELYLPKNSTILDGSSSKDPDGKIASWNWEQISGPSKGKIENKTQAKTKVSELKEGNYSFRLTVTDDDGESNSATVKVRVLPAKNQAPEVHIKKSSISITLPENSTILDGSSSKDPDGKIASWNWEQVSGPSKGKIENKTQAKTKVSELKEGNYSFRLTVTDDDGESNSATVKVRVLPAKNQAPEAHIKKSSISITLPENSTILDGSSSKDPDGKIVSWNWEQISGPSKGKIEDKTQAKTKVSELKEGNYGFRLTVTDDDGESNSATVKVRVLPAKNQAPEAVVWESLISIPLPENSTILDGSSSKDPDGKIVSWNWKQISGPTSATIENENQAKTKISELKEGDYTFQLTVTDNKSATGKAKVEINVYKPLSKIPGNDSNHDQTENGFSIYPNPATDHFNFIMNGPKMGKIKFSIYDINGILILRRHFDKQQRNFHQIIDISKLTKGLYFVVQQMNNSLKMTKKLIKL